MTWHLCETLTEVAVTPLDDWAAMKFPGMEVWLCRGGWQRARLHFEPMAFEDSRPSIDVWVVFLRDEGPVGHHTSLERALDLAVEAVEARDRAAAAAKAPPAVRAAPGDGS